MLSKLTIMVNVKYSSKTKLCELKLLSKLVTRTAMSQVLLTDQQATVFTFDITGDLATKYASSATMSSSWWQLDLQVEFSFRASWCTPNHRTQTCEVQRKDSQLALALQTPDLIGYRN